MDPLFELIQRCEAMTRTEMLRIIADRLPDCRVPENMDQLIRDVVDAATSCGRHISTINTSQLHFSFLRLRGGEPLTWEQLFRVAENVDDEVVEQLFKLSPFRFDGLLILQIHGGRLTLEHVLFDAIGLDMEQESQEFEAHQTRFALPVQRGRAIILSRALDQAHHV